MVRTEAARQAGRGFRRRYPDMFTDDRGRVHPVRGTEGYSELEEHAGALAGERRRRLEDEEEAYRTGERLRDAERNYRELQGAILAEGGIRPDRDYGYDEIPRDVYRKGGKPADEMVALLESEGFHYDRADSMLADLRRRRRLMEAAGRLKPS